MHFWRSVSLSAAALLGAAALAAQPRLIRDFNRDPSPGREQAQINFVPLERGAAYFPASDPIHGLELWTTDGTVAGTRRATDVCAGRCDGQPSSAVALGSRIVFVAQDGFSGFEPWASDGTPGSEQPLADLCPGPCSSRPSPPAHAGELAFFTAEARGLRRLYRTDGTRTGTFEIAALCAPTEPACENLDFGRVPTFKNLAFFAPRGKAEVWASDGTAAGTRPARELFGEALALRTPYDLLPAGDFAVVFAGGSLWRTDATPAGTLRLKDLSELLADPANAGLYSAEVWHGALYLAFGGGELVRTDGSPAGTARLATLPAGTTGLWMAPAAGALLFVVADPQRYYIATQIWRTGGTAETTGLLLDLGPAHFVSALTEAGGRAVFNVTDGAGTVDLWTSDGSPAGTRPLAGIPGSFDPSYLPGNGELALYLTYRETGAGGQGRGLELRRSDGTEAGSFVLHDFDAHPGAGGPLAQIGLGGRLVFSAQTSSTEAPLFASDGTAAGTVEISRRASFANAFGRLGEQAIFPAFATHEEPGFSYLERAGLWKTDGTAAGTVRLSPSVRWLGAPSAAGGKLFFSAEHGFSFGDVDAELFATDPRPGHAGLVRNINRYEVDIGHAHICVGASSSPGPGVAVGGRLVFAAEDGRFGRELWISDGTGEGTRMLRDINPTRIPGKPAGCSDGPDDDRRDTGLSSDPQDLVLLRGGALFTAEDGRSGRELWFTDGTTGGTRRVADLLPGAGGSAPHDLTPFGGRVYFFAALPGGGEALFATDGTARGTVRVRDLTLGGKPTWARELTAAGRRLFFTAWNETTGAELWTSRGDAPSTTLVADLRPGPAGSSPQALVDAGGVLAFAADDGATGLEPWQSDGTAAGTRPLGDLNPGPDASSPGPFTRLGDRLFAGADDGEHGREPWAIPLLR